LGSGRGAPRNEGFGKRGGWCAPRNVSIWNGGQTTPADSSSERAAQKASTQRVRTCGRPQPPAPPFSPPGARPLPCGTPRIFKHTERARVPRTRNRPNHAWPRDRRRSPPPRLAGPQHEAPTAARTLCAPAASAGAAPYFFLLASPHQHYLGPTRHTWIQRVRCVLAWWRGVEGRRATRVPRACPGPPFLASLFACTPSRLPCLFFFLGGPALCRPHTRPATL
jgi:hypothetical protein